MKTPDDLTLCSPETREQFERDKFAFDVALDNLTHSFLRVQREAYAAAECADAGME